MNKSEELIKLLIANDLTLAVAESLTGGMLSSELVNVPGASNTYIEGFVVYSVQAKEDTLGVNVGTIEEYGAVSRQTAYEMADGAALTAGADVTMSTTGNAGPDPSEGKPLGLVYTAVDVLGKISVYEHHFSGSRNEIRKSTVDAVIDECLGAVKEMLKDKVKDE